MVTYDQLYNAAEIYADALASGASEATAQNRAMAAHDLEEIHWNDVLTIAYSEIIDDDG